MFDFSEAIIGKSVLQIQLTKDVDNRCCAYHFIFIMLKGTGMAHRSDIGSLGDWGNDVLTDDGLGRDDVRQVEVDSLEDGGGGGWDGAGPTT